jgi:UDP-2,4-diacetamido-2,4,6-trideoxy-beta-L-altropyranose hydrolase
VTAQKNVIMRADATNALGTGHIMRCLALAGFFQESGWQPTFVSRPDPVAQALLSDASVEWLTEDDDAEGTLEAVDKFAAKAIVLDLSHRDNIGDPKGFANYTARLKTSGVYIAMLDGAGAECISAQIDLPVDMVVMPYITVTEPKHAQGKVFLLGSQYAIYRQEFARMAKIKRALDTDVHNILVTMGGSDPFGLTTRTLQALQLLDLRDITVRVIIGRGFSHELRAAIHEAAAPIKGDVHLVESPRNFAEELLQADLAIINDGLTKYEAAVTGTPSIVLSHDEHQRRLSKDFSEVGCYAPFGPEKIDEPGELARLIQTVRRDVELRQRMSSIGTREFDARGGARVVEKIEKELLNGK